MPRNQFQRMIFALLTVIVTVHAYVFFSLYVINGDYFSSIEGATTSRLHFSHSYSLSSHLSAPYLNLSLQKILKTENSTKKSFCMYLKSIIQKLFP